MSCSTSTSGYQITEKSNLDWRDINKIGKSRGGKKWFPHGQFEHYFAGYRAPSRKWPYSYLRAALTKKFARWLIQNDPTTAVSCGLIVPIETEIAASNLDAANDSLTGASQQNKLCAERTSFHS